MNLMPSSWCLVLSSGFKKISFLQFILNLNTSEHTCTCLRTCAHTHMYTQAYIFTHMHTRTHTHASWHHCIRALAIGFALFTNLLVHYNHSLFTNYRDGIFDLYNTPNDVERPFQVPIFYCFLTHGQKRKDSNRTG